MIKRLPALLFLITIIISYPLWAQTSYQQQSISLPHGRFIKPTLLPTEYTKAPFQVGSKQSAEAIAGELRINQGFSGNLPGATATDNSLAVSKDGTLISLSSTGILITTTQQDKILEASFGQYFKGLGDDLVFLQPQVIYDHTEDKFVIILASSTRKQLFICFSKTHNPSDGWWIYSIEDRAIQQTGFRHSRITINRGNLWVTTSPIGSETSAVILQLEAANGYQGQNISIHYFNHLKDKNGLNVTFLCPVVSNGDREKTYFVSNTADFGNFVSLWTLESLPGATPTISNTSFDVAEYRPPLDAEQDDGGGLLDTDDPRLRSAYLRGDRIHFTFHTGTIRVVTGILYGWYDVKTQEASSDILVTSGIHFAFPAIVPASPSPEDNRSIITFLRSGQRIHPGFACAMVDEQLNWSEILVLKEGTTSYQPGSFILDWGNSTGAVADPTNGTLWLAGSYATNANGLRRVLNTYLAEVQATDFRDLKPQAHFRAEETSLATGTSVQFIDLSSYLPTNWSWEFPGGTPNTSSLQNPEVLYSTAGTYDVTLIVKNETGADTLTLQDYLTVLDSPKPEVRFSANKYVISTSESIQFNDLSTHQPTRWSWEFTGGSPTTSSETNPKVTYPTPGVYSVTLTVSNENGTTTETYKDIIRVVPATKPVADLYARVTTIRPGETITFTDASANGPSTWEWVFEGGVPSQSQSPIQQVAFPEAGLFSISLKVSNSAGADSVVKTAYIQVAAPSIPEAQFQASDTIVLAGSTVDFRDLSQGSPTAWKWTFEGGTPTQSSTQNPRVIFKNPGEFFVNLIASNEFGLGEEKKDRYIVVIPRIIPFTRFSASAIEIQPGDTVKFRDETQYAPHQWEWSIPGAIPETSTKQNPSFVFPKDGLYSVTLRAVNIVGERTTVKVDYITVGSAVTSLEPAAPLALKPEVYPNPCYGEILTATLKTESTASYMISILDSQGRLVQQLPEQLVSSPEQEISIDIQTLGQGMYWLVLFDKSQNRRLHTSFFIKK